MLTFLDFYQTLVGFVNFKLYNDENLIYPPKLDVSKEEAAAGLGAIEIERKSSTLTIENIPEAMNESNHHEVIKDEVPKFHCCVICNYFLKHISGG